MRKHGEWSGWVCACIIVFPPHHTATNYPIYVYILLYTTGVNLYKDCKCMQEGEGCAVISITIYSYSREKTAYRLPAATRVVHYLTVTASPLSSANQRTELSRFSVLNHWCQKGWPLHPFIYHLHTTSLECSVIYTTYHQRPLTLRESITAIN